MRIGHCDRQGVLFGVGPRLLVGAAGAGNRLACDLQIVDELGPGPDGRALSGLRRVLDELVQTRIPVAMPVGFNSHGTLPAFGRAARQPSPAAQSILLSDRWPCNRLITSCLMTQLLPSFLPSTRQVRLALRRAGH